MSSSRTEPEDTAWPDDAPGPTDVPRESGEEQPAAGFDKGGAGKRTGEERAARNREAEPPA